MREVKKLEKDQLRDALSIASKAYPGYIPTGERYEAFEARLLEHFNRESRVWYGLFEDGKILGCMLLFDFTMNYYGQEIKAKGIGVVAVEFLRKKEKVCKELLQWYLQDALRHKYPLAILYAFRPDFYHKMGFGYGTRCYNYVTTPDRIPASPEKFHLQYLSPADKDELIDFYQRLYRDNHGMLMKNSRDIEAMLKTPDLCIAGYKENGVLSSLLLFRLISDESTNHATDMKLELLFTSPRGLQAALNFLHSQADQVRQIFLSTLYPDFFYNFADIRNPDHKILREPGFHHVFDTGMGMMYRSLNPAVLVMKRPCTLDQMTLRFVLSDSFMPECVKDFSLAWTAGKAKLTKKKSFDLEIKCDVADFSAWIVNAIDLTTLYQYGLAEVSKPELLQDIDRAFYYQQKPICLERF